MAKPGSDYLQTPFFPMVVEHLTSSKIHSAALQVTKDVLFSEVAVLCLLYAVSQRWIREKFQYGKHYVGNKKWWKTIMFNYNILLAVYSLVTFVCCLIVLRRVSVLTNDCDVFFRDPLFSWVAYLFYLSKYVEFADTFFILVMQDQTGKVSWLQWFHHLGAPVDMWLLYMTKSEPIWIFVTFNSFIHTLMYIYYAYSVKGMKLLPKTMVTSLQILQFLSGFYVLFFYKNVPCFLNDARRMVGCYYFTYWYVGMVLMLFINFFYVNYVKKGAKGEEGDSVAPKKQAAASGNGTAAAKVTKKDK
jgi:hypothetical protein